MTDRATSTAMAWFQQQQSAAGWFDLLTVMVDGMVRNAGEAESAPFLRQMGESLAQEWPLPASETVGELEANINHFLTLFKWGVVTFSPTESGIELRHQAIPVSRDPERQMRWCNAFCAILEGMYSRWLLTQGGDVRLAVTRERLFSTADVLFRYN
ncbi:cellulose biosynthesis protein BcsD [uncultured Pluralibacter sp.]|uniref:cellulose biosynthesis protein BcsD n=1 Tax=uncultured Pluralibacter sp. TaxID=1490864 RepID=UPI0026122CFB|nr:cellulose biosynthesis protein BcsD [uncultured Pluralibacter sp.]